MVTFAQRQQAEHAGAQDAVTSCCDTTPETGHEAQHQVGTFTTRRGASSISTTKSVAKVAVHAPSSLAPMLDASGPRGEEHDAGSDTGSPMDGGIRQREHGMDR